MPGIKEQLNARARVFDQHRRPIYSRLAAPESFEDHTLAGIAIPPPISPLLNVESYAGQASRVPVIEPWRDGWLDAAELVVGLLAAGGRLGWLVVAQADALV
jgi:hypothetical protein